MAFTRFTHFTLLSVIQMAAAVPADFECSWRHAAFKYAQTLQPDLSKGDLALLASSLTKSSNEGEDCNIKSNTTGAGVIAATVVPARPGRLTRAGAYAKAASSANADGAVTFYVAASKDGKGISKPKSYLKLYNTRARDGVSLQDAHTSHNPCGLSRCFTFRLLRQWCRDRVGTTL